MCQNRTARLGLRAFPLLVAVLSGAATLFAADGRAPDSGQGSATLRWKLEPGQVLRYRIEEEAKLGTDERGLSEKLVMETTWTMDESRLQLAVKVDRIRFTSSGNVGGGPFEVVYDSADKAATGHGAKALAAVFDAIVGSVAQAKMEPHGSLTELELPEEVQKQFGMAAAAELAGFFGETVSIVGLKKRLLFVGVPLPDHDVAHGDKWEHEYTWKLDYGRLKSISGTATYGYFVVDGDENKPIARIRTQGEERLNVEGADIPEIPKVHVTGIIHFDRISGFLVRRSSTRGRGTFIEITTSVERIEPEE